MISVHTISGDHYYLISLIVLGSGIGLRLA